jgi:hypothetical protein
MNGSIKFCQSTATNFVSFAVFFLMLSTIACVVGGGGSESTDCVNISVDSFEVKDGFVAVDNTITYKCDRSVKYIVFETKCLSTSGEVLGIDQASIFYNESLGFEGTEYYLIFIDTKIKQVNACYSVITSVEYMERKWN